MKHILFLICFLFILNTTQKAFASFEDPRFYMDKFAPKTQDENKKLEEQKYKDELKARGLPLSAEEFIKYIKKGNVEIVTLYLNAGIDPNINFYTDYPIYYAAKAGQYEIAKKLLERGAKPNVGFNSALFEAVKKDDAKLAKLLLEYKADPNYTDMVSNSTMLYYALNKKYYDTAKVLMDNGAKIDGKSKFLIEKKKLYHLVPEEK